MAQKQKKHPPQRERKSGNRKRIFTAVIAAFLALLMVLPMLLTALGNAGAVSEAELKNQIDALQAEVEEAKNNREQLQQQLSAVKGQVAKALEEKRLRDQELAYIEQQINATAQQIAYYDELIAQQELDLAAAQEKEAQQYDLFCRRVRAMEEQGTVSYWSILFSAESFSDMLDLFTVVSDIIDYDNAVIDQLRLDRQAVADKLEELNLARQEQNEHKAELDRQHAEQATKVAEAQEVYNNLKNDQAAAEKAVQAEEAAEAAIEKAIKDKEAELEELIRQRQISIEGGYYWPVQGYYHLTSSWTYRHHPLTGTWKMHNGLDIAAPRNAEIRAAKSGIVSVSGWDNSYGNYVVIQHGTGNSTLYAHMNSRAVAAGQTVTQGQVIGYVGMTGSANGYHLHLEVRENGVRVNPYEVYAKYGLPFTFASSYNW